MQRSSLVYLGSFNVPSGIHSGGHANAGFEYGGTALTFNPLRNSLFLVGHDWDQFTAEISIPSLGGMATLLQTLVDASEGKNVGAGTTKVGGNLVYHDKLYFTKYLYYDASDSQTLSHFIRPLDLSVKGQVMGPFRVGSLSAGFYSGYFGLIPAEWQSALGGPVLTGNCCLSIIGRISFGPAAFAIDLANIGVTQNAAPLVYYPSQHPTLAPYHGSANPFWTASTWISGVVFPQGTSSVLFFGRDGLGEPRYGEGTHDPSLDRKPVPGVHGVIYCYDLASDGGKGEHAFSYRHYVWAHDAHDLATVHAGSKNPWDIKPYATWPIDCQADPNGRQALAGCGKTHLRGAV